MLKNVNYIVASYMLQREEVSTERRQLYLQRTIDGLKKLRGFGLLETAVKSVQIWMQPFSCGCDGPDWVDPNPGQNCYCPGESVSQNTQNALDYTATSPTGQGSGGYRWAYLPKDYRKYMQIGVMCNGKLINFDMNDDICLQPGFGGELGGNPGPCNGGQISAMISNCCNGVDVFSGAQYPFYGQPYSYSYTVGSYAVGPGFYHGGYKIIKERNIIVFDQCVPLNWFVLIYVGDLETDAGNILIPPDVEDSYMLQFWIQYMEKFFSDGGRVGQAEKQDAYRTWYQTVRDVNSNKQAFSTVEWIKLLRSFVYQGVKS